MRIPQSLNDASMSDSLPLPMHTACPHAPSALQGCGLVKESHIIDERSEWRTFSDSVGMLERTMQELVKSGAEVTQRTWEVGLGASSFPSVAN